MENITSRVIGIVLFFFLGAILGSYLVTYWTRYKTGRKVLGTKHCFCFSCGKELRAREMWPIISYLICKGKCRYCGSPIGRRVLLCEVMGGLFLLPVGLVLFW